MGDPRQDPHMGSVYFLYKPVGPCRVIDTNPMVLYIKNFVDSYTLWIFNHATKNFNQVPRMNYEESLDI